MGKISNMQQKQNKENGVNLSYARNQSKPRFGIKGIKDVGLLFKPGIEKEYDFYPEEKKLIRALRIGTLSLAALASSAVITVGASYVVNRLPSLSIQNEQAIDELAKQDVLNSAKDKLLLILYQNDLPKREAAYIEYTRDEELSIDTLKIYEKVQSANRKDDLIFSYRRYHNLLERNKTDKNDERINKLLNEMIDIYYSENPSQDDLEKLNMLSSSLRPLDFELENKFSLVDKSLKRDDEER